MADTWIFNDSGGSKTYLGQVIADQTYYQIQPGEHSKWANDSALLTDIGAAAAVVSRNNQSADHITDVNLAINYLKNINQTVTTYAHHDAADLNFRGKGVESTFTAGATETYDWKVEADREFDEIVLICCDHVFGDKVDLQVIDIDNIKGYGPNTILATYFYDYFLAGDQQHQGILKVDYPGTLLKDLYVRFRYYSTGGTDVKFKANLFLHKKG
jgi:hypothetical protein